MFLLTGISHFGDSRDDFIAMVPPVLPLPDQLVTLTGMLELTGALGLLHRKTTPGAAAGLSALLLLMFPANVYAALNGLAVDGTPAMELLPRTLLQLAFLIATLSVSTAWLRLRDGRRACSAPVWRSRLRDLLNAGRTRRRPIDVDRTEAPGP